MLKMACSTIVADNIMLLELIVSSSNVGIIYLLLNRTSTLELVRHCSHYTNVHFITNMHNLLSLLLTLRPNHRPS